MAAKSVIEEELELRILQDPEEWENAIQIQVATSESENYLPILWRFF